VHAESQHLEHMLHAPAVPTSIGRKYPAPGHKRCADQSMQYICTHRETTHQQQELVKLGLLFISLRIMHEHDAYVTPKLTTTGPLHG
jgi:hypothetical protein